MGRRRLHGGRRGELLATFSGGATASFEASRLAQGHLNRNTLEINDEGPVSLTSRT